MDNDSHAYIEVDAEVVKHCHGLGIDAGGSAIKICYVVEQEWRSVCLENKSRVKWRLATFSVKDFGEALDFLEGCHIIDKDDDTIIYATGINAGTRNAQIQQRLPCRLMVLNEEDCFVNAFKYLSAHHAPEDIIQPENSALVEAAKQAAEQRMLLYRNTRDAGLTNLYMTPSGDVFDYPQSESTYPCLLVMCGSAIACLKVEDDTSEFLYVDGIFKGGKTFLGIASLLSGLKDFDQILSLAETGDESRIHNTMSDLNVDQHKKSDDMYGKVLSGRTGENVTFVFGKAAAKTLDDFSSKDVIRGLLHSTCLDVAQFAHLVAMRSRIKRVYFCGSFVRPQLVREMIVEEFVKFNVYHQQLVSKKHNIKCYFPRHGSHYGALGSALNSTLRFLDSSHNAYISVT